MGYLLTTDYKKIIQTDNLNQILGSDYTLLSSIELMAESELKSYLVQKYDTSFEFRSILLYSYNATYYGRNRIYLDAPAYSSSSTYALNSLVLYNGYVYINTSAITVPEAWNASHWLQLNTQYTIYYIDTLNPVYDLYTSYKVGDLVWYKDKTYTCAIDNVGYTPDTNSHYWGTGVSYSVPAIGLPAGNGAFVVGDTRNQQMVTYMTDVVLYHLHSRIAPRNIPDLRVKRYDDAIAWLKQCAKGDDITADLPKIQPTQGMRNRYGSVLPKQNNNF